LIAISVFIKRIVDDKILYARTSARAEVLFYEWVKTMKEEGRFSAIAENKLWMRGARL